MKQKILTFKQKDKLTAFLFKFAVPSLAACHPIVANANISGFIFLSLESCFYFCYPQFFIPHFHNALTYNFQT